MAGIAGLIANAPDASVGAIGSRMVGTLNQVETSQTGHISVDQLNAWIGWSVNIGSFSDCLPIWNEKKNICLVFTGEHFDGRVDRSTENAHWLVDLYEHASDEFFRTLNGFFSGVVVDHRVFPPKLTLFNDRFGLGRIYYAEGESAFYFASEAKSILAVAPRLRQLDTTSLAEYIACGCALENRTLFSGIHLLPPASSWTWQQGVKPRRHRYFELSEWESQPELTPQAFYEGFKEAFSRIVPRYLAGRQPVAMSITGGVDSRMIMAALRPQPNSLPCYTFGGLYRDCADVVIGRQVAKACEQQHEVLQLSGRFFAEFPDIARRCVYLTDGAMDVSGAASLYMNASARKIAPVRLTGNYGGEILRGIVGLKCSSVDESVFAPEFLPSLREVSGRLDRLSRESAHSFVVSKQVPWFHYAMYAAEQSQVTVRTPFLDNELVALAYRAPTAFVLNKNPALRYIWDSEPRLATVPNDRGFVWTPIRLDANRSRFRKLREEFLPRAEYAFDYGMPDWLAKIDRLLAPLHLERLFLGNQKFAHYRIWYRRELSAFVQDLLLDRRTLARSFLNPQRVEEVVVDHIKGTANHTRTIHKLLSCELIHRSLLEDLAA